MRISKRIISYILAFSICFSLCVAPTHAADTVPERVVSFWDTIVHYYNQLGNSWQSLLNHDICPGNTEYQDAHHVFEITHTIVDGREGDYYMCHYCGKLASEVLPDGYNDAVSDMPVNGVTNTGSFVWYPTCNDLAIKSDNQYFMRFWTRLLYDVETLPKEYENAVFSDNGDGIGFDLYPPNGESYVFGNQQVSLFIKVSLLIPVSGYYTTVSNSPAIVLDYIRKDGTKGNTSCDWNNSGQRTKDDIVEFTTQYVYIPSSIAWHGKVYLPVFSVIPSVTALVGHENDYTADTRPAAFIKYYDERIIDESENTFYMPETNESYDMREWSYDYSDRSYHVTTNEGDKYTVTYGDENITVTNENGDSANGFYSWLQKWLIAFKDWLGDKLDNQQGGGAGGATNDLDVYTTDDDTDPADDRAHTHDDDDGAGWLMWFVRRLTKVGSKFLRVVAGVALEDALDGVVDGIDDFASAYDASPGSGENGFAVYDPESVWQ